MDLPTCIVAVYLETDIQYTMAYILSRITALRLFNTTLYINPESIKLGVILNEIFRTFYHICSVNLISI